MRSEATEIDGILLAKRVKEQEDAKQALGIIENRPLSIGIYVLCAMVLAMTLDHIGIPIAERYIISSLILAVLGLAREAAIQRRQINALIKLVGLHSTSGA
jgi:hypothetical protein